VNAGYARPVGRGGAPAGASVIEVFRERLVTGLPVVGLTATALALRLVGSGHGLPFSYNPDEELHFVPHAARAADGDLNPGYFDNPAALTYLLALVLRLRWPGRDLTDLLDTDPGAVLLLARVVVAVLGALLVPLLYGAGRAYADHATGLVAAALGGCAFLPVFYSHQALNDVPTLLPVTAGLVACLRVHERGRWPAYVLAGAAVGVAAATKYTAAPLALVVALASVLRLVERRDRWWPVVARLAAAGVASVVALLALNPYLLLDATTFAEQYANQQGHAATPKLGQDGVGWAYYGQTLLWGLGVVPAVAAVVGAVVLLRRERARALLLLAFPVVLWLYLGGQDRFFARWLLPAYPALVVLAAAGVAYAARRLADTRWVAGRPWPAGVVWAVLLVVLLAQPLADSVRNDRVLLRTDTRTQALAWVRAEVPAPRRMVVEPAVPADYLDALGATTYPVRPPLQRYEATLTPGLVDDYRRRGFCWVMVNSHQRDRGLAAGLAGARGYYERLAAESRVRATFSPYHADVERPAFSYDLSFNWHPRAYARPGPVVVLRELTGCPVR